MPSGLHQRLNRKKSDEKLSYKITRIIIAVVLIAAIFYTARRVTTVTGNQAESAQPGVIVPTSKDGSTEDGVNNNDPKPVPVILKWIINIVNIVGILAVAIMTSGAMYLYDRKKHGRIEPLPILFSEEDPR